MTPRRWLVAGATWGLDLIRPVVERWASTRPVVLCYHSVVDRALPERLGRTGLHLPLAEFRRQLDYLAERCEVVPLSRMLEPDGFAPRRRSRPRVAITFDDGYVNNLRLAAPELASRALPATVFVVTTSVSANRLFWWDELNWVLAAPPPVRGSLGAAVIADLTTADGVEATARAVRRVLIGALPSERSHLLDALGKLVGSVVDPWALDLLRPLHREELADLGSSVTIGNHTATHRVLSGLSPSAAVEDVVAAARALAELVPVGRRLDRAVCYPRGDSNPAIRSALRDTGAVNWGFGLRSVGAPVGEPDPLNLPRTIVGAGRTMARFRLAVAGLTA